MNIYRNLVNKTNIITLIFVFVFVFEFINTFFLHFTSFEKSRILGIYKLLLEIILICTISKNKISRKYFIIGVLIVLFAVTNQVLLNPIWSITWKKQLLEGSFYYYNRFLYIFLLVFAYISWSNQNKIVIQSLKAIEYLLILNAVFIIIGASFDIQLFKTYPNSSRFGYDGLFNRQNQASMIYILLIVFTYYRMIINKVKLYYLLFFIFTATLIGTKVILFFLIILSSFHFTVVSKHKNAFRLLFSASFILIFIFSEQIFQYYFDLFPFWQNLDFGHSLISKIFSTRDLVLLQSIDYVKTNWNLINYIIGGGWYANDFRLIEMDAFAPIVIFGFVGSILYLYFIFVHLFHNKHCLKNALLAIVVLCGFLAGSFFASIMVMTFTYFISHYMTIYTYRNYETVTKQKS